MELDMMTASTANKTTNIANARRAQEAAQSAQSAYNKICAQIRALEINMEEAAEAQDYKRAGDFQKTLARIEAKKPALVQRLQAANSALAEAEAEKDNQRMQPVLAAMEKAGLSIQDVLGSKEFSPVISAMLDSMRASFSNRQGSPFDEFVRVQQHNKR
jgi:hypothetical protein